MKPNPGETYIVGKWLYDGSKIIADANCKRIEELTQGYFLKVTSSPDGWFTVYQDPEDLRYWELSYPKSEMQGGGPPMLFQIDASRINKQAYDPYKKLYREELIVIVQKLLDTEGTFNDELAQFRALEANFANSGSVLSDVYQSIFNAPDGMTAAEIVDKGLAYKPIQLREKFDGE